MDRRKKILPVIEASPRIVASPPLSRIWSNFGAFDHIRVNWYDESFVPADDFRQLDFSALQRVRARGLSMSGQKGKCPTFSLPFDWTNFQRIVSATLKINVLLQVSLNAGNTTIRSFLQS